MKGVFITGATGNVGSRLVKEYLIETDYLLYLLVRGESQQAAEARMAGVLAFWEVTAGEFRDRVRVLRGDLGTPDLGLTTVQIVEVRQNVQIIVHAASNLRLDLTWEKAGREILGGTKHVFALAESLASLERFGYVSTMEVMGRYPGLVREEFLTNHRIEFLNNYERAKFESEEYLRVKMELGFPVTILRVSMVVGEASTGKVLDFRTFYMITEKFLLNPDFQLLPDGAPIDVIPIDFLSSCIVRLMDFVGANGQIYHLSQGLEDRQTLRSYIDLVKPIAESHLGRTLKKPILVWPGIHRWVFWLLSKLSFGKTRRFYAIQLIFLKFFGLNWQFDNRRTQEQFSGFGITWPKFRDYLPKLMSYYFAHRHENRLPF